jgi:hypothetical protein
MGGFLRFLFESAGVRISRLEEALFVIKQFFTKETVTFALGNATA